MSVEDRKPTPHYDALVKGMKETIIRTNKELQNERMELALEKGLVEVFAYHCFRCNYTWLPRDFDYNWREPQTEGGKWFLYGHDLLRREPPKSCARCKSRSWRQITGKRSIKRNRNFEVLSKSIKINRKHSQRWITSNARLRALRRAHGGKLLVDDIIQK